MAGKSFIHVDVDLLKRLYVDEKQTTRQIAAAMCISPKTVIRRLESIGVVMRPTGPEHHMQLKDRDWLVSQYVTQNKSTIKIADQIGASSGVVCSWLKQHGIQRRPRAQNKGKTFGAVARANMSASRKGKYLGADNSNWRGAKIHPDKRLRTSYSTKEWSKAVRKRDGHKCVECGAKGKLHAHHVKPWKTHPDLRHEVSNGITLCPSCHQKAHGWRFPAWAYHDESRTSGEQAQA